MIRDQRQHYILDRLASQGSVRIDDLARALNVSSMTVHRDLDHLERAGQLRKVRGGAVPAASPPEGDDVCVACYAPLSLRTQVALHLADGSQRRACCPHCGLMVLDRSQESVSAFLVTDFLHGRVVNGRTASYLAAPTVSVCCTPTILAFEDVHDARRFQTGFGGQLLSLDEALNFLRAEMHL
jgi:DeoR family transcriptional regulator, copper-sensing transcriptional repressor